jgi:hypothetical protein
MLIIVNGCKTAAHTQKSILFTHFLNVIFTLPPVVDNISSVLLPATAFDTGAIPLEHLAVVCHHVHDPSTFIFPLCPGEIFHCVTH